MTRFLTMVFLLSMDWIIGGKITEILLISQKHCNERSLYDNNTTAKKCSSLLSAPGQMSLQELWAVSGQSCDQMKR